MEECIKYMLDRHDNSIIKHLEILYFTLREMKKQKREYFRDFDYKWVLGIAVIQELKLHDNYRLVKEEPVCLFGIVVEIDYENPYNVQLYEDITNKIAIGLGPEPKQKYAWKFAKWVATEIFDEMWEYNKKAFEEIACRKLVKLGLVKEVDGEYVLTESEE